MEAQDYGKSSINDIIYQVEPLYESHLNIAI